MPCISQLTLSEWRCYQCEHVVTQSLQITLYLSPLSSVISCVSRLARHETRGTSPSVWIDSDNPRFFVSLQTRLHVATGMQAQASAAHGSQSKRKARPEEPWPHPSFLEYLKRYVSTAHYDEIETIAQNDDLEDWQKLWEIAPLLMEYHGGFKLVLYLIESHHATTIVIIWIRVSPYYEVWIIEQTVESQLERLKMGYAALAEGESEMLLFPFAVQAVGVSGYKSADSEDASFNTLISYTKWMLSINKKV